ncbi:hypothetical protein ACQEU8_33240 [Streptomyces sp. CA-250714]|uniref:hypothetical protein n=1 Tax=Streptomyces sp. CA-250714 TaxID=3240060 RepID=UPI003D8B789E
MNTQIAAATPGTGFGAPDYRVDGFEPESESVGWDFVAITLNDDMYAVLAAHHTANGRDTYLLCYDRAAIWEDVPGAAEYVAMHIVRDLSGRTFTIDVKRLPTEPLALNWLLSEGCPAGAVKPDQFPGARPADALTSRLEDQLRYSPVGRYTLLDHYTDNPGSFRDGVEVSVLMHDGHPDSAELPYRVFLEQVDPSFESYTVREGAFPTEEAADEWLMTRESPLPLAPEPSGPSTTDSRIG